MNKLLDKTYISVPLAILFALIVSVFFDLMDGGISFTSDYCQRRS